jgi:hypothetical protein
MRLVWVTDKQLLLNTLLKSHFIFMTKETEKISSQHQNGVPNPLRPEGIVVNLEVINEKLKGAVNFTTWNQRIDRELQKLTQLAAPLQTPEHKTKDTILDF